MFDSLRLSIVVTVEALAEAVAEAVTRQEEDQVGD